MSIYRELDISKIESPKAKAVRKNLERRVVGQTEAKDAVIDIIEKYNSNLYDHSRPIGSALFLGPTGTGKNRIVEALCESVGVNKDSCIKIDCGEFQHSHEIAKLLGSPPGYLGHRETPPRLTQEYLDALHSVDYKLSIVLFDELEKATDALWHMLLGILDKGIVTLGDNRKTDFRKSIILMTSNVGSAEMDSSMHGGLGYVPNTEVDEKKLASIGISAAKKKFTPEFINRLDRIVPFHTLTKNQIQQICDMELAAVQNDVLTKTNPILIFKTSPAAKRRLIEEGFDPKYNGRNIRRVIEREIEIPLARIIASGYVKPMQQVIVDYKDKFTFGVIDEENRVGISNSR